VDKILQSCHLKTYSLVSKSAGFRILLLLIRNQKSCRETTFAGCYPLIHLPPIPTKVCRWNKSQGGQYENIQHDDDILRFLIRNQKSCREAKFAVFCPLIHATHFNECMQVEEITRWTIVIRNQNSCLETKFVGFYPLIHLPPIPSYVCGWKKALGGQYEYPSNSMDDILLYRIHNQTWCRETQFVGFCPLIHLPPISTTVWRWKKSQGGQYENPSNSMDDVLLFLIRNETWCRATMFAGFYPLVHLSPISTTVWRWKKSQGGQQKQTQELFKKSPAARGCPARVCPSGSNPWCPHQEVFCQRHSPMGAELGAGIF
jgi:hypothetical protein